MSEAPPHPPTPATEQPQPACDRCGASPDHEALPFCPDPSTMPPEGWRSLASVFPPMDK